MLSVCVALLAATAVLAVPRAARADCSPQDLANAVESAFNAVTSGACASAASSGVGAGLATALTTGLFAVSAGAGQGSVNDFCNAINNALNTVGDIQSDSTTAEQILGSSAALSAIASFVGDAASVGLDPLNIAACACNVEQNLEQAGSELASCACDIAADLLGSTCNCTPPPTQTAYCGSSIGGCSSFNDTDPGCKGFGPNGSTGIIKTNDGTSPPVVQINGPTGTTVTQYGAQSACAPSWSCFCPKPMTGEWVCDAGLDYNCQQDGEYIFACVCPNGTHVEKDPKTGLDVSVNGISSCFCDSNNQLANLSPNSFEPMCGCPSGQTSWNGNCVAACANNEVRTPDGKCCNPDKVTFCGQCCPNGDVPNLQDGTCHPPGVIQ